MCCETLLKPFFISKETMLSLSQNILVQLEIKSLLILLLREGEESETPIAFLNGTQEPGLSCQCTDHFTKYDHQAITTSPHNPFYTTDGAAKSSHAPGSHSVCAGRNFLKDQPQEPLGRSVKKIDRHVEVKVHVPTRLLVFTSLSHLGEA